MKLVLFLTRGMSLAGWENLGILERECAIYKALLPHLDRVLFVSYGDASEERFIDGLGGIRVLCNEGGLPIDDYIASLPEKISAQVGKGPAVFKSNQVQGSDTALACARALGKPFIARCGYLLSDFMERLHGVESAEAQSARKLESEVFSGAQRVVVTTEAIRERARRYVKRDPERVHVIPNYVRTDEFTPDPSSVVRGRIVTVGRLEKQKNCAALIEAAAGLDVEIVFAGHGSLLHDLQERAKASGVRCVFMGNIPHERLPELINSGEIFAMPSLFEGHPKALIEAMSCGRPCVAANVSGIRELISHRENGYLCGTGASEIRKAIVTVMSEPALAEKMGEKARAFAVENYSLEKILRLELAVYKELTGENA